MSLLRTVLLNKNRLVSRIHNRLCDIALRHRSTGNIEADAGPIKFTESPASKWKAATSRSGVKVARLWYEPYIVLVSLSVFMLYFCVLREENDLDDELQKSLYSRIEGLEEYQLKVSLAYNQQHGLDTSAIVDRLNEIRSQQK